MRTKMNRECSCCRETTELSTSGTLSSRPDQVAINYGRKARFNAQLLAVAGKRSPGAPRSPALQAEAKRVGGRGERAEHGPERRGFGARVGRGVPASPQHRPGGSARPALAWRVRIAADGIFAAAVARAVMSLPRFSRLCHLHRRARVEGSLLPSARRFPSTHC